MSKSTIQPFSSSISAPSSNPSPASGSSVTTPYVSPFAALVPKEVDPDQFSAVNAPDPAKERPLTGRSGADEGSDMPKTEKETPEGEIRPFSEGFENFETRPDPIESSKYTPAEKEKLAKVAGRVPPWWPKDPDKGSYFYGAIQAIKKTGCSAEEVHLAVEKDYTSKELTLKEKTILSAGWPGVMPLFIEKELLSEFKRLFQIAMVPGDYPPRQGIAAERWLLKTLDKPGVPKQIAKLAPDVKKALIPLETATPEEQDASEEAARRIMDEMEKWPEIVPPRPVRKYPDPVYPLPFRGYPYPEPAKRLASETEDGELLKAEKKEYPYPYRYPKPVRGARYPEPESGRGGLGRMRRFSEGMEGGVEKFEKTAEEFLKEIAEKWRRAKDYSPEEMIRLAQIKGAIPPWWPQKPDKTSYFYGHVQAIKKTGCSAEDVRLALEHDLRDEPLTDKEKVILKAGWPEVEPYFIRRAKYPELAFKKLPKPKYLELDDPDMERLLETLPLDIEKKSILEQRWIESFWHSVGKPIRTPGIPLTEREVKALKQDLEKYPESSERWHQIKYQLEHPTEMFPIELKSELNYETKRLSGKVEGFVRAGIIPTRKGKEGFSDEEIEDFEKARADEEEKLITLRTPLKIIADLAEELGMRASDLREKLFRCTQSEKKVFTPTQQRKVQKYFPKHFGMVGKKFKFRGEFEETIRPQSFSENINTDLKTDSFAALSPGEKLVIDLMKVVELGKVAEDPAYQRAIKATGVKVGGYSRILRVFDKLERMKAITKTDQKILQAGWPKLFGKAGAKFVYPIKYFGLRVKTGIARDAARLLASKAGKKIAAKTVAKLALRFVPYIGWGMLAIDIAESKPVQKLWDKYVKDPGSFEENPETLKNGLKSFSKNISRPATFQEPVFAYWRDKIAERTRTDARRVNLILDRVKSRLGYNEARVGILLQRAERRPELLTARELSVLLEILPEKAIEDLQEYGKLKDAATRLSMPVRMVRSLISRAKREPRRIMVVEKNVLRDLWPKDFPEPMFAPR